jgi:DNA replication protein DnaC
MEIKIVGTDDNSNEFQAAYKLRELLNPGLQQLKGRIYIKPNLKVPNTNIQQLDLVVWGEFENGYETPYNLLVKPKDPKNSFRSIDNEIPRKVKFENFFLVIEEKSHDYNGIKTEGDNLFVLYQKEKFYDWSNASNQSNNQTYTVKKGFEDFLNKKHITDIECPFVQNLIWLTGVNYEQTKDLNIINILHSNFDAKHFLQTIARCNPPVGITNPISSALKSSADKIKTLAYIKEYFNFFDTIVYPNSGKLSRNKIERLIQTNIDVANQKYFNEIGKKTVIISGKPGSGKTIHLLNIAYNLYKLQNKRCLLLTYNKTLYADLNRLIYLAKISPDPYNPTIIINRIQAFMRELMIAYEVYEPRYKENKKIDIEYERNVFLGNYEQFLKELNEMIDANWFDEKEIIKIKKDITKFNWDIILIDEAQDWKELERDILYKFFGYKNFVIAYGDKQYLRKTSALKWVEFNNNGTSKNIDAYLNPEIKISYRQSANLINYQNKLLKNESWDLKVFEQLAGGNVEIYSNEFSKNDLARLLKEINESDGAPFDLLMLMPKSYYESINKLSLYKEWGFLFQDCIDDSGKLSIDDASGFRCMHYESCRGLEGYIVICHWFDEYLEVNYNRYSRNLELENMLTDEEAKMRYLANLLFMATSRAIRKIVITLKDKESKFGKLLYESRKINPDYISAS